MIVPNESMNIRFTDDRIAQILRAGVDRDVIRTMKDHIITMNNVSFGLANRILKVAPIEVDTGVEDWVKILCGDEDALLKVYNSHKEPKKEESIVEPVEEHVEEVKVEETVEPEQPEEDAIEEVEVETPADEVVSDSTDEQEAPVEEEPTEDDEDVEEESTSDEAVDETPVFVTGMSTDLDHTDEGVTGTLTVASTNEETVAAPAVATSDPSIKHVENMRRPVNINNNRKHKRH